MSEVLRAIQAATGLGLALSRKFIELHDLRMSVDEAGVPASRPPRGRP
jgi:signal transduction histidine kinase